MNRSLPCLVVFGVTLGGLVLATQNASADPPSLNTLVGGWKCHQASDLPINNAPDIIRYLRVQKDGSFRMYDYVVEGGKWVESGQGNYNAGTGTLPLRGLT